MENEPRIDLLLASYLLGRLAAHILRPAGIALGAALLRGGGEARLLVPHVLGEKGLDVRRGGGGHRSHHGVGHLGQLELPLGRRVF